MSMSSTTVSNFPRITTISSNTSSPPVQGNNGVQIDREVVVTSQKQPLQRAISSPHMKQYRSHGRTQSHDIRSSSRAMSRPRARSNPRMADRSGDRNSASNLDKYSASYPDPSRENMKALAEFLMTTKPPPTNWVSVHSDDEMSLKTVKKYKVFGLEHKKRKRVQKAQVSIQLPPSAVSARTRSGSRHIAISIPWEHDYKEFLEPTKELERPHTAPRTYTSDRGTVTVLKPVAELRESVSTIPTQRASSLTSRAGAMTPPSVILGPEATKTLENYYNQLHRQQQQMRRDPQSSDTNGKQVHIATAMDTSRLDQRFSAGTNYSATTYSTMPGHSRGQSSTSTAPSIAHIGNDLRMENFTSRKSSKRNGLTPAEFGVIPEASTRGPLGTPDEESKRYPMKSASGSINSSSSSSHAHVLVVATADLARGYRSPGPQYLSRTTTPVVGDAPMKKLPDLPRGATSGLPASSSPSRSNSTANTIPRKSSPLKRSDSLPQSRQDRVKAKKLRDLAASRTNSVSSSYFTHTPHQSADLDTPSVAPLLVPPPRIESQLTPGRTHRKTRSRELAYKKSLNTITPIMIVANLPPYTGLVLASDLPSPRTSPYEKSSSADTITSVIHTPPHSIHEDYCHSDSDTIPTQPQSRTFSPKLNSTSQRSSTTSQNALESRRQERRSKRNMTLHERDLDSRITKLEKDNQVLVSTLKVIAGGFGVLNRLFPDVEGVVARYPGEKGGNTSRAEEDRRLESLVRDLRVKRTGSKKSAVGDGGGSTSANSLEGIGRIEESGRVRLEGSE